MREGEGAVPAHAAAALSNAVVVLQVCVCVVRASLLVSRCQGQGGIEAVLGPLCSVVSCTLFMLFFRCRRAAASLGSFVLLPHAWQHFLLNDKQVLSWPGNGRGWGMRVVRGCGVCTTQQQQGQAAGRRRAVYVGQSVRREDDWARDQGNTFGWLRRA